MQPNCFYLQHNKHNMNIIESLFSLIAPHQCLGCGQEGTLLCKVCFSLIPFPILGCYRCKRGTQTICSDCAPYSPLHQLTVTSSYSGISQELVQRLKFGRTPAAAVCIATAMAARVRSRSHDIITHAPTATGRIRQRGYDQSALIAKHLSSVTGVPYQETLTRDGQHRQLGQNRTVRQQQQAGAYSLKVGANVAQKSILLVDDVITTGSTMEAAATARPR